MILYQFLLFYSSMIHPSCILLPLLGEIWVMLLSPRLWFKTKTCDPLTAATRGRGGCVCRAGRAASPCLSASRCNKNRTKLRRRSCRRGCWACWTVIMNQVLYLSKQLGRGTDPLTVNQYIHYQELFLPPVQFDNFLEILRNLIIQL